MQFGEIDWNVLKQEIIFFQTLKSLEKYKGKSLHWSQLYLNCISNLQFMKKTIYEIKYQSPNMIRAE